MFYTLLLIIINFVPILIWFNKPKIFDLYITKIK